MRRLIAVLATWSIIVAQVAGCHSSLSPSSPSSSAGSSPQQVDHPLPDATALLKQSSATAGSLTSLHLALSVTGKVEKMPVKTLEADLANEPHAADTGDTDTTTTNPPGSPPGTTTNSESDTDARGEPDTAAKGSATITIMGSDVDVRFVVVGGHLYVALPDEDWKDYGPASNVYNVATILTPETGLANMLADFIDPKVEARETIAGEQTVRIVGKVTADAVNRLVPQLEVTKRMPCTVWIQESGDHQLVRATLEAGKDDEIQMTFSKWNAPVTVERPAGA